MDNTLSLNVKLYELRLMSVQKYVGYKRCSICTHWNADYLLKNFSSEGHENVVDLNIFMKYSSVYLLLESEFPSKRFLAIVYLTWIDFSSRPLW